MAISEIQRVEATGAATSTLIQVFPSSIDVGQVIRVLVRCDDDPTGITVDDNAGNTYLSPSGFIIEAGTTQVLQEFYCIVEFGGVTSISATYDVSVTGRAIAAIEYSGVTAADGTDGETDTGSNPTTTLSITNTTQPAVMFCACNNVQGGTPTAGAGFVDDGLIWSGFSNTRLQYKEISTVAAQTGNFGNAALDRNNATALMLSTLGSPENPGARRSQYRIQPMIRGPM